MHLRVVCLLDWHLEVFFYYKTKNAEVMIFQSYTPTFILEPKRIANIEKTADWILGPVGGL